jgi:hypothetical protein
MKKLKSMSKNDLINLYWDKFGSCGENIPTRRLIAALFFGKMAQYVTQEEIDSTNEY